MKKVCLTQEQEAQVRDLYVIDGHSCEEIGKMFGCSEVVVWRRISELGLTQEEKEQHLEARRKIRPKITRKREKRVDGLKILPHKNRLTDSQKERVIMLHDNGKTFDQIARLMGIGREQCRISYSRNAKKRHESGFYASSKWCSGCMYFGRLGSTPCCDYTYLTGHAKLREGEPACTCRYKEIGKRPKVEEE